MHVLTQLIESLVFSQLRYYVGVYNMSTRHLRKQNPLKKTLNAYHLGQAYVGIYSGRHAIVWLVASA